PVEVVEKEDGLPDLVFLQEVLPRRHRGVPGTPFFGEARTSLGYPPEEIRVAQQRDCFRQVGRDWIQPVYEHAGAGGVIAMAEDAVPIVDLLTVGEVFAELRGIRALEMHEGVLPGVEIDPLVVNGDLSRRCRVDRSRE